MLLSKATTRETALFPVKASDATVNACYGYPYNCYGGLAMVQE